MMFSIPRIALAITLCGGLGLGSLRAQDPPEPKGKVLDLGKYKVTAPGGWKQQEPKFSLIKYEFSSPAKEDDKADGRMTISVAGGPLDANLQRWYGQFSQPDGGSTKEKAKIDKRTIAGLEVHLIEISGTYREQFGAAGESPNYRLLGAIVVAPEGNIYLKYYGPRKTVTANEKPFKEMVDSLAVK